MFVKSLFILVAAVLLSGFITSTFAFDDMEIVKRIVMPACSGDANTRPAICGQLSRLSTMGSGPVHPVSFKREVEDLARRYILLGCSGDPATRPAQCSKGVTTGSLAGHKFNALRRSSEIDELSKRYVNLRCSGDPAKVPADCLTQQTHTGPKIGGHTLSLLQLREELAARDFANELIRSRPLRLPSRKGPHVIVN